MGKVASRVGCPAVLRVAARWHHVLGSGRVTVPGPHGRGFPRRGQEGSGTLGAPATSRQVFHLAAGVAPQPGVVSGNRRQEAAAPKRVSIHALPEPRRGAVAQEEAALGGRPRRPGLAQLHARQLQRGQSGHRPPSPAAPFVAGAGLLAREGRRPRHDLRTTTSCEPGQVVRGPGLS